MFSFTVQKSDFTGPLPMLNQHTVKCTCTFYNTVHDLTIYYMTWNKCNCQYKYLCNNDLKDNTVYMHGGGGHAEVIGISKRRMIVWCFILLFISRAHLEHFLNLCKKLHNVFTCRYALS